MNDFVTENHIGDVVVDQKRYDELLHKEALLDAIKNLHSRISDYSFRDVVGHLIKSSRTESADE